MRLHLFGHSQLIDQHGQTAKLGAAAITLLAYLVLQKRRQQRADLATLFYPKADSRRGRANISKLLWELRQVIDDGCFERDYHSIKVVGQQDWWVDAQAFETDLRRIGFEWTTGQATNETLAGWLDSTLALYDGPLLQDAFLPDSPALEQWLLVEQERFRRLFLDWSQRLAQFRHARREWQEADQVLIRAQRVDPDDEVIQVLRLHGLAARKEWEQLQAADRTYRSQLRSELGGAPSAEYLRLVRSLKDLGYNEPQTRAPEPESAPAARLYHQPAVWTAAPAPLTQLFGRDEQIERIVRRLLGPGERLLTLVGLGGVGKTVLAQVVASRLAPAFRNGVCFITLADLPYTTDPDIARRQLALAVADALGMQRRADQPIEESLFAFLRAQALLLVLDNLDNVMAAAPLLGELLAAVPQVRILATSRQRLNLVAENVEPVCGLSVPSEQSSAAELLDNDAVRLFAARARRVLPAFQLTPENAVTVGRICNALGGLPLAIELAAQWVTIFTLHEIAAAIERSIGFLVTPHGDVAERHRSLLAVFDTSWRLLTTEQQDTLAALSFFQNRFDRQTALEVAGSDLPTLISLVDHSVLELKTPGVYALHPVIKALVASRRSAEESVELRYLTTILRRLIPDPAAMETAPLQAPVDFSRFADLAQAWELAVEKRCDNLLAEVLPRFGEYWRDADQPDTAVRLLTLLRNALERDATPTASQQMLLGWVLFQLALTYRYQGLSKAAFQHIQQAREILEHRVDPSDQARLYFHLGEMAHAIEQREMASGALQQALVSARSQRDSILQFRVECRLAIIAWASADWNRSDAWLRAAQATAGQEVECELLLFDLYWEAFQHAAMSWHWDRAAQLYAEADAWCARRHITPRQELYRLEMLAMLLVGQERWREAYQTTQEKLANPAVANSPTERCMALFSAGRVALRTDLTAAVSHAEALFQLAGEEQLSQLLPDAYGLLGCVRARQGRYHEARHLLVRQIELAQARRKQMYAFRQIVSGMFFLARLEQATIPRPLFEQIVRLAATNPGVGLMTRIDAQDLARTESIPLATHDEGAPPSVDWAELDGLAGELLRHVQLGVPDHGQNSRAKKTFEVLGDLEGLIAQTSAQLGHVK